MSQRSRSRIAFRLVWLATTSFALLAVSTRDGRLYGLASFAVLFISALVVLEAFRSGNEWPSETERRGAAAFASSWEPAPGAVWSWPRLASAYEVVSAGLVIWLATALVVGATMNLISGSSGTWADKALIAAITSPAAVPWPIKRWPPPVASGSRWVTALIKRRLTLTVLLVPSVLVLAFSLDRLVSESSTLSLALQLVGVGVIALVVALTVRLGRYLPPRTSPVNRSAGRNVGVADEGLDPHTTERAAEPPDLPVRRFAKAASLFEPARAAMTAWLDRFKTHSTTSGDRSATRGVAVTGEDSTQQPTEPARSAYSIRGLGGAASLFELVCGSALFPLVTFALAEFVIARTLPAGIESDAFVDYLELFGFMPTIWWLSRRLPQ